MEFSNDNILDNLGNVLSFDKNSNQSSINHSGNSDVDVIVQIDTKPIAFAMLCSLLATKQLSNEDFELAVRKLEELANPEKIHSVKEVNDVSKAKIFNKRRR
jgi:hypothetical protein